MSPAQLLFFPICPATSNFSLQLHLPYVSSLLFLSLQVSPSDLQPLPAVCRPLSLCLRLICLPVWVCVCLTVCFCPPTPPLCLSLRYPGKRPAGMKSSPGLPRTEEGELPVWVHMSDWHNSSTPKPLATAGKYSAVSVPSTQNKAPSMLTLQAAPRAQRKWKIILSHLGWRNAQQ